MDRPEETVQTLIRLLLQEQFNLGLHCLPLHLHLMGTLLHCQNQNLHFENNHTGFKPRYLKLGDILFRFSGFREVLRWVLVLSICSDLNFSFS